MTDSNYETIRALTDKMRIQFNSIVVRMTEEIQAISATNDPPGLITRRQARARIDCVIVASAKVSAAFVSSVTESCGVEVGERAQVEADHLLATIRTLAYGLIAKHTRRGDATLH